jgi:hypothetical protein
LIIVRVELHSAITGKVTELARMMIHNTGGTNTKGDYGVEVYRGRDKDALDVAQKSRIAQRTGKVLGYARLSRHVWNLVAIALKETGYGDH